MTTNPKMNTYRRRIRGRKIARRNIRRWFKDEHKQVTHSRMHALAERICVRHGVDPFMIVSSSRMPNVVRCREEICYRLTYEHGMSCPEAGILLGKPHSTIHEAAKRYEQRIIAAIST